MKTIFALTMAVSLGATAQQSVNFHDEFAKLLQKEQVPGAQLVLFNQQGITHSWSFGEAAPGIAVNANTLFRAGSTTKTLTAMAVLQLSAQHAFSLQDDVLKLEPLLQLNNPYQEQEPVRVIHLLEHTAGLDDMHFRNFYNEQDPGIDHLAAVNRDSAALKVRWLPGTRHAYSNPGYGILGHLVARFSGNSFEQYVTAHLLKPLNMQPCAVLADNQAPAALSQGYENGEVVPYRQIYLRAAGNLVCNAEGLAQMALYLLRRGGDSPLPGLDAGVIRQMEIPQTTLAAKSGLQYGYGKAIYHASRQDQEWLGHNGGIDGFTTSYGYSPQTGQGYALMVNTSSANFGELTKTIAGHLQNQAQQQGSVEKYLQAATDTSTQPRLIDGYYRLSDERNEIFAGLSRPFAVVKLTQSEKGLLLSPLLGTDEHFESRGGAFYSKAGRAFATGISLPDTSIGNAFQLDGQFFLQTTAWSAWSLFLMVMAGVISIATALLYAPFWLYQRWRGRVSAGTAVQLRLAPLCFSLLIISICIAMLQHSLYSVSQLNWQNLMLMLGTLLLPLVCLWQWWSCWRAGVNSTSFARFFAWFSVLANTGLTLYLWSCGYLGLRLWAW